MKDASFFILQFFYCKRISFCQYTLGTVVLIFSVDVFKIYRFSTRKHLYLYSSRPHFFDSFVFAGSQCSHQFVVVFIFQVLDAV